MSCKICLAARYSCASCNSILSVFLGDVVLQNTSNLDCVKKENQKGSCKSFHSFRSGFLKIKIFVCLVAQAV